MPKEYSVKVVQPLGAHNKPYPCIHTDEVKEYIKLPFEYLNPLQSDFLPFLEDDETNIIISAETSSGKTLIAELFAARAISLGKRILYVAPMKALADEKYEDWTNKKHTFNKYNIEILTGDFILDESRRKRLEKADIISLTPEMLNAKCRSFSNHKWLKNTDLIVDEMHLIGLQKRGSSLEVGIIQYYENCKDARSLFLSATLPNVEDIGVWLKHMTDKEYKVITSSYRPCKLNKRFIGFDASGKYGRKSRYQEIEELRKDETIRILEDYCGEEPTLIFTGSKLYGASLSNKLNKMGVKHAFHNADLPREKRKKIESDFVSGKNNILIATSTLAWGCVKGDTKVKTVNGYERIDSINSNKVIAVNNSNIEYSESKFKRKIVINNKIKMKKIILEDGKSVVCTSNHVFPTDICLDKKASELSENDFLITFDDNGKFSECQIKSILDHTSCETVYDLSMKKEDFNYYIVNGIVTHNCNTPARHVIQCHTSFGLTPMHPSNVLQSIGRAGRAGWSDRGDAYILVPRTSSDSIDKERKRILENYKIESTLNDKTLLMFHILSYVVDGTIKSVEDVKDWYYRTLASIQNNDLDENMPEKVLSGLKARNMIKVEDGIYKPTIIGKITAKMYMSPLDVYDWIQSFKKLNHLNPEDYMSSEEKDNVNLQASLALAACYSWGATWKLDAESPVLVKAPNTYITALEKNTNEIKILSAKIGVRPEEHPFLRYVAVFYSNLSGQSEYLSTAFNAIKTGLDRDYDRIVSTMRQIDEQVGKKFNLQGKCSGFNWGGEWDIFSLRLKYGVDRKLIPLVSIQGIGRKIAHKLYSNGIKNIKDISNPENAEKCIFAMKEKRYATIYENLTGEKIEIKGIGYRNGSR